MRISSLRPRPCEAASPASLAILLLLGCSSDTPRFIEPPAPLGARSAAAKSKLTVNGAGSTGEGTVLSSRGGITCTVTVTGGVVKTKGKCSQDFNTGTSLTLTASPAGNAVLSGWVGCTAVMESPLSCEVTMDQARTVSAIFSPPPQSHLLRISGGAGGDGRVTSSPAGINCTITAGIAGATGCSASFAVGRAVTLSAVSSAGSYLKSWAGGGCDASGTGVGGASGSCVTTMSQPRIIAVAFDLPATIASLGKWDAPLGWPGVAIHAHVLPDGRVMTWGRMDRPPVLWNPTTGAFGSTSHPVDFFCSGHTFLPDGRLLASGGHSGINNQGIRSTAIFDFATGGWTVGPDMRNGRWYPTTTTLASGELLTVSGGDTIQQRNLIPEVYQADGTWRELTTASLFLPYYPFMFVAPNGLVFAAGPSPTTYWLDPTGTGKWTNGAQSTYGVRDYGSAVMYDAGKILIMGGNPTNVAPTRTAEVIDLNAGTAAVWRSVGPMSVGRTQLNATLLANGEVLVTGGSDGTGFNAPPTSDAVLSAELWDPATEQWKTLARMGHHRLYHSTALLLPDARVLSVGGGQPAASGFTDDLTAEIFNPPYLFVADGTPAPRPTITSAPTAVGYGQAFAVSTPNAADVRAVTWIRLGSVTHAFNESQRLNRLSFSLGGATSLTVTAPASGALAPPGHYMLFLIDSLGVPSVAKIIRIS